MIFKTYQFLQEYDLQALQLKIQIYKDLLKKFNHIHNLTHVKNIDENIYDSIKILDFYDFSWAKNIVDIGSGAGFPAIFLAFVLDNDFHLFEPNLKKVAFLRSVKIECNLNHLHIYKEKVQNHKNTLKADIITSRALMDVKPLLEICKNIQRQNTIFILWKGSEIYKELQDVKNYKIFENNLRKYCILKQP